MSNKTKQRVIRQCQVDNQQVVLGKQHDEFADEDRKASVDPQLAPSDNSTLCGDSGRAGNYLIGAAL